MEDTFFCPYCFKSFNADQTVFKCIELHDDGSSPFFKAPKMMYTKSVPKAGKCPVCSGHTIQKVCPNCEKEIYSDVEVIAVAGPQTCGKTVYISAVVKEMERKLGNFGLTVVPLGETLTTVTKQYTIDEEGGNLPAGTLQGLKRPPLMFEISKNDKKLILVLYDAAGEDFRRENFSIANAALQQLSFATMILMIIDPLQIEKMRNNPLLADTVNAHISQKAKQQTNADAISVATGRLRQLNEKKTGRTFKGKFPQTVAACIGLTDVLHSIYKSAGELPPPFAQDSSHIERQKYVELQARAIAKSVQNTLINWGEKTFMNELEKFKEIQYFGFTSLGQHPDKENRVRAYQPQNVLDPILYLLAKRKLIDTVQS